MLTPGVKALSAGKTENVAESKGGILVTFQFALFFCAATVKNNS